MDYSLTPDQVRAFRSLERAFKECEKAGVYVWDAYGNISGVNGHVVGEVAPDPTLALELDDDQVSWFSPACYGGAIADDKCFVRLK